MKMVRIADRRELIALSLVLSVSVVFALFSLSISSLNTIYDFLAVYTSVPVMESFINIIFLSLIGLLWLTYRSWKLAATKQKELEDIISSISPDVLMVVNADGNIVMCNDSVKRMFGYEVGEVINQKADLLYYFESNSQPRLWSEVYNKLVNEGFHVGLAKGKKKNGDTIPLEIITGKLSGKSEAVLLLCDMTEHKKLQAEILSLKEFNESIVQNMKEGIVIEDTKGYLTFINPSIEEMLGYSSDELIGEHWSKVVSQRSLGNVEEAMAKMGGRKGSKFEVYLRTKHRGEIPVIATASLLLKDDDINGILSVITDITSQKHLQEQLQEQLLQSEKLSTVGQLLSGVAHELNNPLTGIMGYSQLVLGEDVSDEVKRDLEKINNEAMRCHRIVQNLLGFARKHKPEKSCVAINGILESTLQLRAYELELNNIEVVKELDENLPKIMADFHQLQQVFLNIITNAEQAMLEFKSGGKLTVKTEVVELSRPTKKTLEREEFIRINFTDTGPGIPKKNLNKLFEPFFTTKEVGQGTGLGLSLAYGIVKEHDGNIYARSKVGVSTTFVIELPLKDCSTIKEQVSDTVAKNDKVITGKSILIVDDEQTIIELLFDILRKNGNEVDTARDGRVALKKIGERNYDLILLDIKMPGIGGRQVYKHLRENNSRIARRVIFSTGDTVSEGTRMFLEETGNRFISKPFMINELQDVIQKTLSINGD